MDSKSWHRPTVDSQQQNSSQAIQFQHPTSRIKVVNFDTIARQSPYRGSSSTNINYRSPFRSMHGNVITNLRDKDNLDALQRELYERQRVNSSHYQFPTRDESRSHQTDLSHAFFDEEHRAFNEDYLNVNYMNNLHDKENYRPQARVHTQRTPYQPMPLVPHERSSATNVYPSFTASTLTSNQTNNHASHQTTGHEETLTDDRLEQIIENSSATSESNVSKET